MENYFNEAIIQSQPYSEQQLQAPPAIYLNPSLQIQSLLNHQNQYYNQKSALQKMIKQKSESHITIEPKTKKISKKNQKSNAPQLTPLKGKIIKQFQHAQTPILTALSLKGLTNCEIQLMPSCQLNNKINSLTMLLGQLDLSHYPWQLQRAFQNNLSFDQMLQVINQLDTPIETNQFVEGINRMKGLTTLQQNILEKQIQQRFCEEKEEVLQSRNEIQILKGHNIVLQKNIEQILAKNSQQQSKIENSQLHTEFQSQQYLPQYSQQSNIYPKVMEKPQKIRFNQDIKKEIKKQSNEGVQDKFQLNESTNEQQMFQEVNQNVQNRENFDQPEITNKRKISDLFNELCNRNSQIDNQFNLQEISQQEQPVYQQPPYLEINTNDVVDPFLQDKFFNNDPEYF